VARRVLGLTVAAVPIAATLAFGLCVPLLIGAGQPAIADRVLLVLLDASRNPARITSALRPYAATAHTDRVVIVEPRLGRWPCAHGQRPVPAPAVPAYCPALVRFLAHLTKPPVVLGSVQAVALNGDGQASAASEVGIRTLLTRLYGPGVTVSGGPVVFVGQLPGAGLPLQAAVSVAVLIAIAVTALGIWRWARSHSPAARARRARPPRLIGPAPMRPVSPTESTLARSTSDALSGNGEQRVTRENPVASLAATSPRAAGRSGAPVAGVAATAPDVLPPVLGEISHAARRPWGLPPEPSPSAIAADSVTVGGLEIRAASIVGPGHRAQEPAIPRQDAYRLAQDVAGRYLLIAVADGMSDSKNSDLGANVAANAIITELRQALAGSEPGQLSVAELYRAVSGQMVAIAKQRGITADTVRTVTLAAVIPILPDQDGRRRAWFGGVSDVGAWRRQPDGWQQVAGQHRGGMDANALSEFLPYHPNRAVATMVDLAPHDVLALVTDGVSDAFGIINGAAAWFAERWRDPPPIASFILDVGYEARTQNDDRTAVVVWCDSTTWSLAGKGAAGTVSQARLRSAKRT
jgi:hypothetical protein